MNEKNIFNQAAIVQLKVSGFALGTYEKHALFGHEREFATQVLGDEPVTGYENTVVPRNLKLKTLEGKEMDKMIQDKIEILERIKTQSLKVEDFDHCKLLKGIIDKLKILGNQIWRMNQEKKMAIENEDYEIAKQLKFQIEQIRMAAA